MKILKNKDWKFLRSENVNYDFNLKTGLMITYGKTKEDDAVFSPYGPFILDLEITTKCNGINGTLCPYCYKSNNNTNWKNMSFETFIKVINNVNQMHQLTQVAFGLGSTAEENPDLWRMCQYLRDNYIIPNGTVANISDETADKIAKNFGACAVSLHSNKDICYDSVKKLTDRGLKQTNIHAVIFEENFKETMNLLNDVKKDDRLKNLNALVLLSLKNKGRAEKTFTPLCQEKFIQIVKKAKELNISLGFDSCSCHKFAIASKGIFSEKLISTVAEPCEISLFSGYINVEGKYFPCSFAENEKGWEDGIDIVQPTDFVDNVWLSDKVNKTRNALLRNKRNCLFFKI